MGRVYELGQAPRPPVARFTHDDGTVSAFYVIEGSSIEIPDGVVAVEIRQLPVFPQDYPAADEPGWGLKDGSAAPPDAPGDGAAVRVQVRGREHFQSLAGH